MIPVMKSYIRILIGVGIVALVGVAVWFGTHRLQIASVPSSSESPSVSPVASASPLVLSYTAAPKDWPVFSSKSLGFSVAYPGDWHTGACGADCEGWAPASLASGQFVLGIIKSTGTLDDVLTKAQPYLVAKEDIKIGALTWLKLTLRQPDTNAIFTSHFIVHGTVLYEFGTASPEPAIVATYGSMIASFKFLK
jgi:hypothetical protein